MREIIYGRQPVCEVLRGRRSVIDGLWMAKGLQAPGGGVVDVAVTLAEGRGVPIRETDQRELERICGDVNHQGLAAQVSEYVYSGMDDILKDASVRTEPPLILVLDHLQDPQNLGSILRTADAGGVHGVIIPKDRAVEITPAVVRASAGASEHVRVSRVTNLVQTMKALRDEGLWFAGLEAIPEAKLHTAADLKGPLGLVVGSEGQGLGRLVRETCDFWIRLPMRGKVSSLNAGVACGIALYEILRQRGLQEAGQPKSKGNASA